MDLLSNVVPGGDPGYVTVGRSGGGASGAFTAGLVERIESLSLGVTYALAPFLSPQFFGPGGIGLVGEVLGALEDP